MASARTTPDEAQPAPDLELSRDGLPPKLRLLWVGSREPAWVALALRLDAAGCREPKLDWVSSSGKALSLLRDQHFDCVVVAYEALEAGAAVNLVDLAVANVLRTAGYAEPIVLVAPELSEEFWSEACRLDCEVLIAPAPVESPALVPMVVRSLRRAELSRENHRLSVADRRRLSRERDEAEHLLNEQRQMIQQLRRETYLPAEINEYYQELLRTYVIMGSGSLAAEIARLGRMIAEAGFRPRDLLDVHLERVEALVQGLGNRSARHVLARADLLALELMMALGEHYRQRCA